LIAHEAQNAFWTPKIALRSNKNPTDGQLRPRGYEKRWRRHRLSCGQATAAPRKRRENRIARWRAYHCRFTRLPECLRFRLPSGMVSLSRVARPMFSTSLDSPARSEWFCYALKCSCEFKPFGNSRDPKAGDVPSRTARQRRSVSALADLRYRETAICTRDSGHSATLQTVLSYSPRGSKLEPVATQLSPSEDFFRSPARGFRSASGTSNDQYATAA
jgi:hypothetical protein